MSKSFRKGLTLKLSSEGAWNLQDKDRRALVVQGEKEPLPAGGHSTKVRKVHEWWCRRSRWLRKQGTGVSHHLELIVPRVLRCIWEGSSDLDGHLPQVRQDLRRQPYHLSQAFQTIKASEAKLYLGLCTSMCHFWEMQPYNLLEAISE